MERGYGTECIAEVGQGLGVGWDMGRERDGASVGMGDETGWHTRQHGVRGGTAYGTG